MTILVVATSIPAAEALAGGYRIFLECVRAWVDLACHNVHVITSPGGRIMTDRYLQSRKLTYTVVPFPSIIGSLAVRYLPAAVAFHLGMALTASLLAISRPTVPRGRTVIYSVTPFWPDVFPARILSHRSRGGKWMAGFNMFAPSPFRGFSTSRGPLKCWPELRGIAFFLNQVVAYPLIRRHADLILVNNEMDFARCIEEGIVPERLAIVGKGVDLGLVQQTAPDGRTEYDAVFIGRLHPQKGVLELVEIWKRVVEARPGAQLAVIGNGPLERRLRSRIQEMGLAGNVHLLGFMDGVEKVKVFRRSKLVVHPAVYDSGGMAALEAMACGLPGISFDLPALRTYYPVGMLKVPCYDLRAFADAILLLLGDPQKRDELGRAAQSWAASWEWKEVAMNLLRRLDGLFTEQ